MSSTASVPLSQKFKLPNGVEYEQPLGLFVNGEFVTGKEGKAFEVINPATGKTVGLVHEATAADVDIAVDAAEAAFYDGPWSKMSSADRGCLLLKLADLFEENLTVLASIEAFDNGKAIQLAKGDISACIGCLRYYGGWADKIHGKVIETSPESFNYTKQEPIGVCGQIIPWNFPLLMWAWKIGPAIACGNTVVNEEEQVRLFLEAVGSGFEIWKRLKRAEVRRGLTIEDLTTDFLEESRNEEKESAFAIRAKGGSGHGKKRETRTCFKCGKKWHIAKDCWSKTPKDQGPRLNMAASAFNSDRDLRTAWFIDSGATAHICCQAELFEELDTSWKKPLDGVWEAVCEPKELEQ